MIEWLGIVIVSLRSSCLSRSRHWNQLTRNMFRDSRGDDHCSFERWLMTGNPLHACFSIETYQGCQSAVVGQASRCADQTGKILADLPWRLKRHRASRVLDHRQRAMCVLVIRQQDG